MTRVRFQAWALLIGALALTMALAGCGGDDGVDQSVHDMALAERDAAMAAQEEAEAEAEAEHAEAEAAAAEAAAAEAEAEQAEADRMAAEAEAAAAAEQAEADRMAAEQAEADRMAAEAAAAAALQAEKDKASAAMDAAKMASDAAKMASDEAAMATMNMATLQTGAMSEMHAYNAKKYAKMAMDEYMKAKAASEAAMAAEDTATAALAAAEAEAAQMAAENAAMMVANDDMDGYADKAKKYAMMELKIDGTMKSVGDTMIDAAAPKTEVTSGTGANAQTTITGLVSEPTTQSSSTAGVAGRDANPTAQDATMRAYMPLTFGANARSLKIGKDVDSADDMARLRIITAYEGRQMVNVYARAATVGHMSNKEGAVELTETGTAITTATDLGGETNVTRDLRPVGMFYLIGGTATDLPTDTATAPAEATNVAAGTKAKQVYSFRNDLVDPAATVYVVLDETTAVTPDPGETTTRYDYRIVDIHVALNVDGLGETDAAGDDDALVKANLPVPKSYSHLHFGVWAHLGEADKDGMQDVANLGIGFVQSVGDGMTADMPITGSATYNGNWAGTVQEQNEGDIELATGKATLTADFVKDTLMADLDGLVELEGDLAGNTFSGNQKDMVVDPANAFGLNASGKFTGTFSGAFYGDAAVEAGGIFDFTSEDIAHGAFRGAFGGQTDDNE